MLKFAQLKLPRVISPKPKEVWQPPVPQETVEDIKYLDATKRRKPVPTKPKATVTTLHPVSTKEDARKVAKQGLEGLGLKVAEVKAALDKASGESAEEILSSALRAHATDLPNPESVKGGNASLQRKIAKIREAIQSGRLRVVSVNALKDYDINSRGTAQKVIAQLVDEGLLERLKSGRVRVIEAA